jgi:hypothetical protein
VAEAAVFCEKGEKGRAHFQWFVIQLTSHPVVHISEEEIRAVRSERTRTAVEMDQILRNMREGYKRAGGSNQAYGDLQKLMQGEVPNWSDASPLTDQQSGTPLLTGEYGYLANVVHPDDVQKMNGYMGKEMDEMHSVGAILQQAVDHVLGCIDVHCSLLAEGKASKKLSYDGRIVLTRAKIHYLVRSFKLRYGIERLDPAFETVVKWMLATGRYLLCHQYMTGEPDPIRENAYQLLEGVPGMADTRPELVPIIMYGMEKGSTCMADLDRVLGPSRVDGLPSYALLHSLTLKQAKHAATVGQLADGTRLALPQRRSIGCAVVIDRETSRGVALSALQALQARSFKIRQFVDNYGLQDHDTFVAALAASWFCSKGIEFFTATEQSRVDALQAQDALDALATALGVQLFVGGHAQPKPLSNVAITDYMDDDEHVVIRSPATFDGVCTLAEFEECLAASTVAIAASADILPAVHVMIVRSSDAANAHTFTIAWQCSREHMLEILAQSPAGEGSA